MKKAILLSLTAALALSSTAAAYAEPANTGSGVDKTITITAAKSVGPVGEITAEITGVIEEMTEQYMRVKAKDGQLYWIPLEAFSKQEGFDQLGLAKGVEVTVKSLKPAEAGAVGVTKASGDAIMLQRVEELKDVEAVKGKVKIWNKEDGNAAFTLKDEVVVTKASPVELKDGEKLLVPGEITANGKTVKLDIKVMTGATRIEKSLLPEEISGTIQSINENEMTVKTKDEKTYMIPLKQFSQLEGFKGLGLEKGVEVNLKRAEMVAFTISSFGGNDGTIDITIAQKAEKALDSTSVTVKKGTFKVLEKTEAGKVVKALPELKPVFIAKEIEAKGKTVKLPE